MKSAIKKLAVAAAATFAFAAPSASAAQGDIFVFNNSSQFIAPYFKFHCFNTPWLNFGGIVGNSQFGWGSLVPDGCEVEFTYTQFGGPPPQDPVKGNHRTRFTFEADGVHFLVIGTGAITRELEGPGETGR